MPNGSPLNIPVTLEDVGGTKKVQAPDRTAMKGTAPVLTWEPQTAGLQIQFIGFNDPVGQGRDIAQPAPQGGSNNWIALDKNTAAKPWSYTIYASLDGVVYSSDPQIINEGEGGDDMEDEEDGRGNGSGG